MPFSPFFACCPSAQLPSSVQISSEKAGPLICSQEEPGPPTLSSVRSNLALSPWGWPCCSLFTATRLANRPWGQARASLEPSTLNSIWLRLENKDQDCFTLQGKLKTAKLKLHWNLVHSRDILSLNQFFTPTHSVYRCHGPQLQAVPWEPREGPGPGQPSSVWRWSLQARWRALHRRHSASFASLLCFHFPSLRNHFQRMMSVENDSTMHASYSSIPADLSLTVLKLSIKQHKEEKNDKSFSI